jgi:hypothetical protein
VRRKTNDPEPPTSRRKPATTSEGRETQLVSLAEDLAEKQLMEGTASAQVISHYLKLGSSRERLEQQRIAHENELMKVKIESFAAQNRIEELYLGAINAMRSYTGQEPMFEGAIDED